MDRPVDITALRLDGEQRVVHAYAVWNGWVFDHSGWKIAHGLLANLMSVVPA